MSKLSFISKLGILIDTSLNSKIYLVLLLVLIFLGIALATTNKKNNKIHKIGEMFFGSKKELNYVLDLIKE